MAAKPHTSDYHNRFSQQINNVSSDTIRLGGIETGNYPCAAPTVSAIRAPRIPIGLG